MNIVIAHNSKIPATEYGGIERVIWYLGAELVNMRHKITFLVKAGSVCGFADVKILNPSISINEQIPVNTDFVHLHFQPNENIDLPHLITVHGNLPNGSLFFPNTNFVSKNHALRYGANAFVYNGLDWDDYGKPDFSGKGNYVHFLGKASWRIKNVRSAINIAHQNKTEIKIIGGTRLNIKMGFRFTTSKWAAFYGMVGGEQKLDLLKHSKALIFPVLWHEPFGLAIIESLFFGCPVLATKYGSLPELISDELGFLSNNENELIKEFKNIGSYKSKFCHQYAADIFNSKIMAENYLLLYEKILNGEKINMNLPQYVEKENVLPNFIQ
jgi:glycosyltransferase involved in cell wall biosynthesis